MIREISANDRPTAIRKTRFSLPRLNHLQAAGMSTIMERSDELCQKSSTSMTASILSTYRPTLGKKCQYQLKVKAAFASENNSFQRSILEEKCLSLYMEKDVEACTWKANGA
jgi:hypothetical protein